MAKGKSVSREWGKVDDRLFTLEVCIIDGPPRSSSKRKRPFAGLSRFVQTKPWKTCTI